MDAPLIVIKHCFNIAVLRWCLLLLACYAPTHVWAQLSNERVKVLASADTIVLDSLSLIPQSVQISTLDGTPCKAFMVLNVKSQLIRIDSTFSDSIRVSYRVFPTAFPSRIFNKDTTLITAAGSGMIQAYVPQPFTAENLLDDSGIRKSGSISRGVSFGNAQNLTVNSNLNLQMNGRLSDRFQLLASISDDNIPIQPNGSTQQLQDFDQVFIQIFDDKTKIIAGDFLLKKPQGYFTNYFKRSQGAYFFTNEKVKEKTLTVEASASVSKGRFARNVIQGIEGNQGPYRLTGADNELFIVILAGTEAVFIDGRKLERGQDRDYIIDYNAAEIIFTPKQFITKDRRIVVEFQYSDRRYARPLLHTALTYGDESALTFLNLYSESDAKNQPLQQDLTGDQRELLANAGDDPLAAFTSGIDSVGYSSSQVLYALVDSLGFDSVLVFSTNPEDAIYRAQFTNVGLGNGDYVEDGFTANGRKFKWVSPILVDGVFVSQGSYVPQLLLVAPKKRQLIHAGHRRKWSDKNTASVEAALSVNDLNTFSGRDANDDVGYAVKGGWEIFSKKKIINDSLQRARYSVGGQYEYNSRTFVGIERFREVEFDRNWNLLGLNLISDLQWIGVQGGWEKDKIGNAWVGGEYLSIGSGYNGQKANVGTNIRTQKWTVITKGSALETDGLRNTSFVRHQSEVSRVLGKFKLTFKDEHELNRYFLESRDSVLSNSYRFYDWQVIAGTSDTLKTSVSVYYRDRLDWRPREGLLLGSARADEYGANWSQRGKRENRMNIRVSNRRLRAIDPELFTQQPENTLIGRVEYYYKAPSGWLQSSTFYEIGSGLEQRREFIYLEVPAGQGNYVWRDYNNDGVRDLNEFEVAQFVYEANYIRSFVQTTDYVRTYTNQFSQSVQIQTGKNWKKTNGWKKFVAKWSDQASYRIDRKTNREDEQDRFNPFISNLGDTVLLALGGSFRNTLFFNKSHPRFTADYTYQQLQNKNLLSNGFESRGEDYHQLAFRWAFVQDIAFASEQRLGVRDVSSDFLSGRNYSLQYTSIKPSIIWQPQTSSRFNLNGEYSEKENTLGIERAKVLSYGAGFTLNSIEKGSLQGGLKFYNIQYNGDGNTSLAFDILEGLNVGFNATWNIIIQRTVAKNLQLSLTYDGRKPQGIPAIHAGGVQLRAFF